MQIFRYAEQGSIGLLWISGTNPAVSLPELRRIRRILAQDRSLFVVVQDAVPDRDGRARRRRAAGRRSGARRPGTLHQRRPHRPPLGARRSTRPARPARTSTSSSTTPAGMDFRDRDGAAARRRGPTPEEAFEAWKECTARPALRLHRAELRQAARGQRHPVALQRASARTARSGSTPTACSRPTRTTARLRPRPGHRRRRSPRPSTGPTEPAAGRSSRRPSVPPPHEWAGGEYPFTLTTGRTVYHFHTRTKTGRAPELEAAAPEAGWSCARRTPSGSASPRATWCASPRRAARSWLRRASAASARASSSSRSTTATGTSADGADAGDGRPRAANELTITRLGPGLQAAALQGGGGARGQEADSGGRPSPAPTWRGSPPRLRIARGGRREALEGLTWRY